MIIVLKKNCDEHEIEKLILSLTEDGFNCVVKNFGDHRLIAVSGEVYRLDAEHIRAYDIVESVKRITEPYLLASKSVFEKRSFFAGGKRIGEGLTIIAGPCSVESEKQIITLACAVKEAGADFLRAGAYKPRTSPYAFQGLGEDGIRLLTKAKRETGLPVVSEIVSEKDLSLFDDIDVVQIGARNMQNYALIKEVAKSGKPVLLKRGAMATVEELLLSAEYLLSYGAENVALCERGIRTFDSVTRNALDVSSLPALKELTCLPVIVDPSHASGNRRYVAPLSYASVSAGADGLMIEVHDDAKRALSDGAQAITPNELKIIVSKAKEIQKLVYKPVNTQF